MADGRAYTRTRTEWVALVVRSVAIAVGLVGGFGTLAHFVTAGTVRVGFPVPVIGLGSVLGSCAVVGLATGGLVAVLGRPKLLRVPTAGGAGGSAGHGELWPGTAVPAERGEPGAHLAQGVTR